MALLAIPPIRRDRRLYSRVISIRIPTVVIRPVDPVREGSVCCFWLITDSFTQGGLIAMASEHFVEVVGVCWLAIGEAADDCPDGMV
jgi:hypothetical protein